MMGRLPSKFLFSIVLYSAGFVTAVYFMAPNSASAADQSRDSHEAGFRLQSAQTVTAGIDSKVWISKIHAGIDTSIHFAEENALKVANLIRSQMAQGSHPSSQTAVE